MSAEAVSLPPSTLPNSSLPPQRVSDSSPETSRGSRLSQTATFSSALHPPLTEVTFRLLTSLPEMDFTLSAHPYGVKAGKSKKNDWVQRKLAEKWQKQKAEVMTDMGLGAVWWHSSTASVSMLPIHTIMFDWHNYVAVYSIVFNFIDYYISFQQSAKYTNTTYLISQCKSLRWHLHITRDVKKTAAPVRWKDEIQ